MSDRELYKPGPASGAHVRKDEGKWALVLARELRHSPEKVWLALTDPRTCENGLLLKQIETWVLLEPR